MNLSTPKVKKTQAISAQEMILCKIEILNNLGRITIPIILAKIEDKAKEKPALNLEESKLLMTLAVRLVVWIRVSLSQTRNT